MDTNRPQTSDDEGAQPPPLPARSPYRPLSRQRRQAQPVQAQSAVERPTTGAVFTASPNTIAAARARTGAAPDETTLAWRRTDGRDPEVDGGA
jgi:hypothetical protein